MNRLLKKNISILLMLFVLLAALQIPVAGAEAGPEAKLNTNTVAQTVYLGNSFRATINISGVTDTVYQQVYEHEATVTFDPGQLELTQVLAPYNTFNEPVLTELSPGKIKVYTSLKEGKAGLAFNQGARNFAVFLFKPKTLTQAASVSVSDISITNGQGNKLELNDASTTVSVLPAGDKEPLKALVTVAQNVHDSAVEGTLDGQYPYGSKNTLKTAINKAESLANSTEEQSQDKLDQEAASLQAALAAFEASVIVSNPGSGSLQDGEYTLGFTIYKKGTNEPSVMYDYVDRNSGKLQVQNGKKYVSFTLKQSAETLSFKTEKNGALVETTTVSSDAATNTRVVQFEVDDLSARLNGWVKVYWVLPAPIGIYDHEYEIELGFGAVSSEYPLQFTALHATKDQPSSMDNYLLKPGKLIVQQDKKKVSFTVKDSTTVTSLKVEKNGTFVETQVVSTDPAANTRTVEFEVTDLTALLNAQVHISTTMPNGTPYEMDHTIRLKFNIGSKTALNALIADAQANYHAAVEGSYKGQYPAGSKSELLTAIQAAKKSAENPALSQEQVDNTAAALQQALAKFQAAVHASNPLPANPNDLADGEYMIPFSALHATKEQLSSMENYFLKPGKLTVQQGKKESVFHRKRKLCHPAISSGAKRCIDRYDHCKHQCGE